MIAFLTDWGYKSYYVGVVKAVIKRLNPNVEIIDITHEVEPFNVKMGAYILQKVVRDFPKGTVFLAVVDYGVGTGRKALALQTRDGYFFVGPDNGLFTLVIEEHGLLEIRELTNVKYFYGKETSYVFHGRDIFAPVAVHISKGVPLKVFGNIMPSYEVLKVKKAKVKNGEVFGEVAYADWFGNISTNIPERYLKEVNKEYDEILNVKIGKKTYKIPYVRTFGEVDAGELLIHPDEYGYLEISVNQGSAFNRLKVNQGDEIKIW